MRHGKGKETGPDSSIFEGDFENGNKHGKGTYKWPDGTCYEGEV